MANYVLGAGKIYFDDGTGERYIGCSETFNLTAESEKVMHYCAEDGVKVKVDEATLQTDYKCGFVTSEISNENLAMFFFGSIGAVASAAALAVEETLLNTKIGRFYQIGKTALNPTGVRNIANVIVKVGVVTKTITTDYKIDLALGRIEIVGGGIAEGDDVIVTYDTTVSTRDQIIAAGSSVTGALKFISNNIRGSQRDVYIPDATLSPTGDFALKGDEYQKIGFDVGINKGDLAAVYLDSRPV